MIKKRYEYDYKRFVFISLGMALINTIVGILCVSFIDGNNGVIRIVSYALVNIIFSIVLYIINFRNGFKNLNFEHIKYAIKFNIPMIPHYFSTYILNQSDRIMIQKMVSKTKVGMYNVSYNAGMLLTLVSSSMINALTPWYYDKLENEKQSDVSKIFVPLTLCVLIPIFIFILFAPEALKILAPSLYHEAIYIIPPVSTSIIFIFMYSFFSTAEFYYDKNKFSAIISSIAAVINIILNYIFIMVFDYRAAGYTTLLSYFILSLGHYLYGNKVMKEKTGKRFISFKTYITISIIIFIYVLLVCLLYDHMLIRYALSIILLIIAIIKKDELYSTLKKIKK